MPANLLMFYENSRQMWRNYPSLPKEAYKPPLNFYKQRGCIAHFRSSDSCSILLMP